MDVIAPPLVQGGPPYLGMAVFSESWLCEAASTGAPEAAALYELIHSYRTWHV